MRSVLLYASAAPIEVLVALLVNLQHFSLRLRQPSHCSEYECSRRPFSSQSSLLWILLLMHSLIVAWPLSGFASCRHSAPLWHAAERLKPLRDFLAAHPDREFFIANRVLPLATSVHVMAVFCRTQDETVDPVFEKCWRRYKTGDDT